MTTTPEIIEKPLTYDELGHMYRQMCDDPLFANVPGKIEVDRWGRKVMSPASVYHGLLQARLIRRLEVLAGETLVEAPIVTPAGILVPDVAWVSAGFMRDHRGETPLLRAPELCIEVASPSSSRKEFREKTVAYFAAGATEVWIVFSQSRHFELHGNTGLLSASSFPVTLDNLFD